MCMGCMAQADFLATGGVLGVAGLRVGARSLLGKRGRGARKVSDAEADAFVASLQVGEPPTPTASLHDSGTGAADESRAAERVPVLTGPPNRYASAPDG